MNEKRHLRNVKMHLYVLEKLQQQQKQSVRIKMSGLEFSACLAT